MGIDYTDIDSYREKGRPSGKNEAEVRADFEEREYQRNRERRGAAQIVSGVKAEAMGKVGTAFDQRGAVGSEVPDQYDLIKKTARNVRGRTSQMC